MTSTDKLFRTFDGLQADIDELLTRYRRVKQDRAALLAACKRVLGDLNDYSLHIGTEDDVRHAVQKAEEES